MLAAFGLPPGPVEMFFLAFLVLKIGLIVALVSYLFRKFPSIMRGLGRGIEQFQRGVDEGPGGK
ncbi:MAG: twin-arginine translocase TatA/TatE family subunit [Armatimonadota bacterium]